MNTPAPMFRRWLRWGAVVSLLAVAASLVRAQTPLVANSPFAPSGASTLGGSASAGQDFELTGSTAEGSTVTVCIYTRQTKRSQWIPVGGVSDGIRVVSFDSDHDQAVVMVGGVRKDISMRKATFNGRGGPGQGGTPQMVPAIAFNPPPVVAPGPPPADAVPAAKTETEQREARMLVSDLLEIGVQQRKAFQAARQKAAAGSPPSPSN